jgi:RNA polymerase sigma-70 factor (ECF subfamily)
VTVLNTLGECDPLVRALQQKEPGAMAELYDRYSVAVYSRIYAMVRNEALAEDLVQEVFLRVWRRVESFDHTRGSLGTWIQAVARNCAIDYLRSRGGRLERQTYSIDAKPVDSRFTCENEAVHCDLFGRLGDAVGKLNRHQRKALQLAFHEGLSHAEMATRLQEPLGTIKTRIRRALHCLRADMLCY